MNVTDKILSKANSGITVAQYKMYYKQQGAHRIDFVNEYLDTGQKLCEQQGINYDFFVAQADHESGSFKSEKFDEHGNTVGLGITDSQDLSLDYANGSQMAYGHVIHLTIYTKGKISKTDPLYSYIKYDPRYQAVIDAGWDGTVKVIDDLTGKWASKASSPNYGQRICDRFAEIQGGIKTTPGTTAADWIFDRYPMPAYVDRTGPLSVNMAWDDLGVRDWLGLIVWHTMYGSLWGTDDYFMNEARFKALTDFGVGDINTDGADNDGKILMWNNPHGRRTPYASGPVNNPIDDGLAFYLRYGKNAVNKNGVSIERSGLSGNSPLSQKARLSIMNLTGHYADEYASYLKKTKGYIGFNPDTFPLIPNEGRSIIAWHGEINADKRDSCPGQVVMSETGGMIREIKQMWWNFANPGTTIPDAPTYARPVPAKDGTWKAENGAIFIDINDQKFTLVREVTPRLWALRDAPPTGDPFKPGNVIVASHVVTSSDGESWLVMTDGSRIPAAALVAK